MSLVLAGDRPAAPAEPDVPGQGPADRRAVLPGRGRGGGARRRRDQRGDGRAERAGPRAHAGAGARRPRPPRLPPRAGLRPRDGRRDDGPPGGGGCASGCWAAHDHASRPSSSCSSAVLSVFLATVEASFNLLKRRRLTQVGFHDEARVELAQRYLDDPPRMLMPVHLGTYTAHVGMTVIITSLAFRPRGPLGDAHRLRRHDGVPAALPPERALHPGAAGPGGHVPAPPARVPPLGAGPRARSSRRLRRRAAPDPEEAEEARPGARGPAAAGAARPTRSGWWTPSTASRRRSAREVMTPGPTSWPSPPPRPSPPCGG